jgi:histidyl-tRNA synthetase
MPLSTKPYKGARDFYPEDKRLQKYMFSKWRGICESYGYEEYDAPILEPLDIYLAKTGDEIVNEQTYTFTDRGGRQVVIRPEMTPTVSRMVAARRQELAYPLRWYSIPNLWRYERPQRGRLREHWQLNVDIFGVSDISAEFEIISLVDSVFKSFDAKPNMYEIRLNHRQLIDYLLSDFLDMDSKTQYSVSKLIDRLNKMERPDFIANVDNILSDKQRRDGVTEKLMTLLESKKISDLPEVARNQSSAQELKELIETLTSAGVNCIFDGSLMRGFDYYTGIVFEVYDKDPLNNRSMLGGGRYDGLVGLFGVTPVPTVGFGWGDVTLANFLSGHHLLSDIKPETDVYIALIGNLEFEAQALAQELRTQGLNAAVDLSKRKLGDQLKTAAKKSYGYVIVIGEDEVKSKQYKLKNLVTGEESELSTSQLIKELKRETNSL